MAACGVQLPVRLALIGWPPAVEPLPPVSLWAESPAEAWRLFDERVACLALQPWDLPADVAFVLTARVDGLPQGLDPRCWLPLRGRADWVQCVHACGRRVWRRDLSTAGFCCPICGGGLRPWVRFARDSGWIQAANAGAENRLWEVVERIRGRGVELWCRDLADDRTLLRLAERLRKDLDAKPSGV